MPAIGYENVRGLDVAMHDALGMRGVERIGDLNAERKQSVEFHRAPCDHVLQRRAVEEFHHDEGAAILLADVVNGADVGMIERRRGLGFALKTAQGLGIAGDFIGKELEGDKTVEAGVLRLVNHAHAAAPQLFDDPVVGDGLADHSGKNRWRAILWLAGGKPITLAGLGLKTKTKAFTRIDR